MAIILSSLEAESWFIIIMAAELALIVELAGRNFARQSQSSYMA
jgi:hypothetical protein